MKRALLTQAEYDYIERYKQVWGLTDASLNILEHCSEPGRTEKEIGEMCGVSDTRVGKLLFEVRVSIDARKRFKPSKCKYLTVRTIKVLQKAGYVTEADLLSYLEAGGELQDIYGIGREREKEIRFCL